jgi:anti-sigma regulatory factor (Ser/Thr protein kinase)
VLPWPGGHPGITARLWYQVHSVVVIGGEGGGRDVTVPARPGSRYRHDVLFHATEDDLLAAAVPFLRAGLDAGDAVVLMCDGPVVEVLTGAAGGDDGIGYLPRAASYRRTPAVIAECQELITRAMADGATQVRLVGDVDLGVPADVAEWGRYEAVCNAALAALPVWSLCLYDTARLPAGVVSAGRATHPHLVDGGGRAANPDYLEPVEYLRRSASVGAEAIEAGPADVHRGRFQRAELDRVRRDVHRTMADRGVPTATIESFVVAMNEVVSNALQHGRPPVSLDVWSTPDRSVCVVSDSGPGFDDPLAGYVAPSLRGAGGLGLYLTRHLCDRVSFERGAGRFTVRVAVGH